MVVIVLVSVCWNDVHDVCQKSSQIVCCLNHYPSDELRFQLGGASVWSGDDDQWDSTNGVNIGLIHFAEAIEAVDE
jgi:hypothetical protein